MKPGTWTLLTLLTLVLTVIVVLACPSQTQSIPALGDWRVVDLTQPLTPIIPIWAGDPMVEIQPWATHAEEGYFINRIAIGEHSGTHWGTPNTLIEGARSAEQVPIERLIAPVVVIDIREKVKQDVDYRLSVQDLQAWEAVHGKVAPGSIVILFTGWQDKWSNSTAFMNQDRQGVSHWAGFGIQAAQFLVSEWQVAGLGTDTHGVDPGNDQTFGASSAVYTADGIVLECLGGLDKLPPIGATVVIGGLPIQGGSGSPARVFAFLPPSD